LIRVHVRLIFFEEHVRLIQCVLTFSIFNIKVRWNHYNINKLVMHGHNKIEKEYDIKLDKNRI